MSSYVKKPGSGTLRVKTAKETHRDFDKRSNAIAAGRIKPGSPPKKK